MPYFISDNNPDCDGWAVQKENGEVIGCHTNREDAIDQMVAVSLAEDIPVGGYIDNDEKNIKQYTPPEGAVEEAKRGLKWREEYNRGGTAVGVARARDISNRRQLSEETIKRMVSYFARHEVDKQAEGFSPGEEGFPSAGRIAWALWGGDPGQVWANKIARQIENEEEKSTNNKMEATQMKIKSFPVNKIEVKAANDEAPFGEFTAIVSVFGNVDLVGDRVMPGAFASSLKKYAEKGTNLPIVWSHDWGNAESFIGKTLSAEETDEGLLIRGAFFDTQRAQTVRTLLAEKVVSEFSFAYDVIKERKGEDGYNELIELSILEAGPTLKGANPATQLIAAKNLTKDDVIKAEPNELTEGSMVSWGTDEFGRVEYIMTEGTFGIEGDELSLTATADNPLALVRVYSYNNDQNNDENEENDNQTEDLNEYLPTNIFRSFLFSDLQLVEMKQETEKTNRIDNVKAGRTLSSKNETRILQAKNLLDDVLGSLETADPVKSKEPILVKGEHLGLLPETAISLLELYDNDL